MARLDRLAPVKEVAQVGGLHRPRVRPRAAGRGGAAGRGRAAGRAGPALPVRAGLPPRRRRRRRPTPSSTRWCGTRPTRACSGAGGSSCTPGSPRSWRRDFPETVEAEPELLAHHCAEAGLAEKAVGYWLKAGRAGDRALGDRGGDRAAAEGAGAARRACRDDRERAGLELELQAALGGALIAPRASRRPRRATPSPGPASCAGELGRAAAALPGAVRAVRVPPQRAPSSTGRSRSRRSCCARPQEQDETRAAGHRAPRRRRRVVLPRRAGPAREHLERALALYDPAAAPLAGVPLRRSTRAWRARAACPGSSSSSATPSRPWRGAAQALAAGPRAGPSRQLAIALFFACALYAAAAATGSGPGAGRGAASRSRRSKASRSGRRAATVFEGWALADGGRGGGRASRAIRQGIAAYRATGARACDPYFLALLAEAQQRAGQVRKRHETAGRGLGRAARTGER